MTKIRLQILTPLKKILDEEVESVILRTTEGDMGILYDHEPVVTLLDYNTIQYTQEGVKKVATTMGGFAEITSDRVVVLTDASEFPEEIDEERARQAKERAQKRLADKSMDRIRAEVALKKAITRMNLKGSI
ncbi:ATP synthase F1 subunit epsilon [Sporanaerobium hydrogeniformans]|uniref:ATP synthase F1 subunit epsilon n=1 Tax=Sporanaerobium hydrogeniformans TaxID=3072179 RepID=A0AC61D9C2_9FIRM|nr:ATP synthase F1 subunit epsilon [Sporanaerobium hydrogeniformans]PHV69855.1 ATP synthase F1 subunit epsilon [Sporanaerobium hydrogeniformans]